MKSIIKNRQNLYYISVNCLQRVCRTLQLVLLTELFFVSFYLGHWKETVTIVLHNTVESK